MPPPWVRSGTLLPPVRVGPDSRPLHELSGVVVLFLGLPVTTRTWRPEPKDYTAVIPGSVGLPGRGILYSHVLLDST